MNKLTADMGMGRNLRVLRKKHGYTQDQIVGQMSRYGVLTTRSLYSRLETGELNIPIRVLIALHLIYKCSFDEFFKGLNLEDLSGPPEGAYLLYHRLPVLLPLPGKSQALLPAPEQKGAWKAGHADNRCDDSLFHQWDLLRDTNGRGSADIR